MAKTKYVKTSQPTSLLFYANQTKSDELLSAERIAISFNVVKPFSAKSTRCFISICHFMTTYISITVEDMKTKLFFKN